MVVHIVMFKFKDKNKEQNILKTAEKLNALVDLVPSLNSMEVGIDFNKTQRAFDMSIYTTFNTQEDLKKYATHPAHLNVVNFIKEVTYESKVVDYNKEDGS